MIGLGLALSHLLPDTALATYAYILISYHLVLAFKVFTADKEAGMSLPWGQTILTHMACVGLLIGLAMGRHTIPFFGLIRLAMPGLAPFEASWLFSGEKVKLARLTDLEQIEAATLAPVLKQSDTGVAPASAPASALAPASAVASAVATSAPSASITGVAGLASNSSGEDYEEFLKLMQQGKRPFRRPGVSVMQEYELWLTHRSKSNSHTVQSSTPAQSSVQA
jgi:hypothetical protein